DLPRASDPSLAEFARQTRDLVDLRLRTPWTMHHSDGRVQQVPPIDNRFQPEQVLLRTDTVPPEIHIAFRWAGERTLFGVRERVKHDDDEARAVGGTPPDHPPPILAISLHQTLLARAHTS